MKSSITQWRRRLSFLLKVLALFVTIQLWEALCIPGVSHTPSNGGIGFSIVGLLAGAIWLRPDFPRPSTCFVYGFAGSLLFVYRFLMMDRFHLWVHYQAPSDAIIMLGWYGFASLLGLLSCFVCLLLPDSREGDDDSSQGSVDRNPTSEAL